MADVPSVLVACPTYKAKDYALRRFVAGYRALDYPEDRRRLLMVNTRDDDYVHRLVEAGVDVVKRYLQEVTPEDLTGLLGIISHAWQEAIIPEAWRAPYDYVFSLEADMVVPPDTLRMFVDIAERTGAWVVSAMYGLRVDTCYRAGMPAIPTCADGLGCVLFRRMLFGPGEDLTDYFEVYLYKKAHDNERGIVRLEGVLDIDHLLE